MVFVDLNTIQRSDVWSTHSGRVFRGPIRDNSQQGLSMDTAVDVSPKVIPNDATTFEAGGKVFHKASGLSLNRYGWMEDLNVELGYGRNPMDLFKDHKAAFQQLNKQEFAEAAVSLHYAMTGIARIADREPHAAVKMCMLFWNYEGEDVKTMTDDLMAEKIELVTKEGFDAAFFFTQALSNAPGLLAAYRLSIQNTSEKEEAKGPESGGQNELKT